MKKIFLLSFILLTISFPAISSASPRAVTIQWTMPHTSGVQGYKMYYAYNSDMTNKVYHHDCDAPVETTPNNFSMTCHNANIESYPVYFTISAITTNGDFTSSIKEMDTAISTVKDFKIIPKP